MAYKVPVRPMRGDANVRKSTVDPMGHRMAVDYDGTITHFEIAFTKEIVDTVRLKELGRRVQRWKMSRGKVRWKEEKSELEVSVVCL